ncbi:nuclease-related domain-containing DEAD/DEAH box helicase [Planktothrix mougeotii]|uniref:AAA family ATPase n=1 Tax=Planktothrix mougeotii LEGE 06226 TaxID=1828728 RepID=A0ABR9U7E3_9CYAN|nr:AAA family ATPase [Planktothrix mougeotii]MBE9142362.1 AAA family ATPase [Planktothrix mougeotii LEGE 06226]
MAQCFPPLEDINNFRVPLTPGERHLLDFLLNNLNDNYEIYVQPFLNGDRPDLVIVRPDAGVLVIEVKDWKLSNYTNPKGGSFSWLLKKDESKILSPLKQVESYKENLYKLHIDKLFEAKIQDSKFFSVVQTAVYFDNESTKSAESFCSNPGYTQILGNDALNAIFFNRVLGKARLNTPSKLFNKDLYKSFKRFLNPPEHTPDIGREIQYTNRQQELIQSYANKRQKVRGVAGCGKTKVLAARAVAAYSRTKEIVLILTFNITLRNYIHDRVSEVRAPFTWSAFEITNYHQFFKTKSNNYGLVYEDLIMASDQENFFEPVKNRINRYQTILVDEVQDYKQEWLRLLVNYFLAEDGEFVVFGDEKQNVYGRQMGDDRFPIIPTVPGRWNELKESFRMETATLRVAQAFQDFYFKGCYQLDSDVEVVQNNLFETPASVKYYHKPGISDKDIFCLIQKEILDLNIHPNDLVILAPTHEAVRTLEYQFRKEAHECTTHAGETEEEYKNLLAKSERNNVKNPEKDPSFKRGLEEIRRGRKLHFWPNAGTVKLSTIHSFKGWETHTLVLIISNTDKIKEEGSLNELIYTALTRARKNLIVIDSTNLYREFFGRFLEKGNH